MKMHSFYTNASSRIQPRWYMNMESMVQRNFEKTACFRRHCQAHRKKSHGERLVLHILSTYFGHIHGFIAELQFWKATRLWKAWISHATRSTRRRILYFPSPLMENLPWNYGLSYRDPILHQPAKESRADQRQGSRTSRSPSKQNLQGAFRCGVDADFFEKKTYLRKCLAWGVHFVRHWLLGKDFFANETCTARAHLSTLMRMKLAWGVHFVPHWLCGKRLFCESCIAGSLRSTLFFISSRGMEDHCGGPDPQEWLGRKSEDDIKLLEKCYRWSKAKNFYDTEFPRRDKGASADEHKEARKLARAFHQWRRNQGITLFSLGEECPCLCHICVCAIHSYSGVDDMEDLWSAQATMKKASRLRRKTTRNEVGCTFSFTYIFPCRKEGHKSRKQQQRCTQSLKHTWRFVCFFSRFVYMCIDA